MKSLVDRLEPRQYFSVNTMDIFPSDRALLRTVAANEGETLFVRPDEQGNPVIGIGFQLGNPRAQNTLKRYGVSGVNYDALIQKWDGIRFSWQRAGYRLEDLKTDPAHKPLWERFAQRMGFSNQNESTRDIDYTQSTVLFRKMMVGVIENDLPAVFGTDYIDHDYRVQTGLADLVFDQGRNKVSGMTRFVEAVNHNQYGTASKLLLKTTYAQLNPSRARTNATLLGQAALASFSADSVADFSGIQGYKNWYYGYNTGQDGDFKFLTTFNGNWYNRLGKGGYWTQLWPTGGHPNSPDGNDGRLPELQLAIRRYLSPVEGTVRIQGNYDAPTSLVYILIDGQRVWTSQGKPTNGTYRIDVPVLVRSTIDFVINPAGNDVDDSTTFTARIEPVT